MSAARKLCPHPECVSYLPCSEHVVKPWASSTRSQKVKSGWAQQKRAKRVLRYYNTLCGICNKPGSTEVDHVLSLGEGGTDTFDNLQPVHHECHREKSLREARRGKGC